MPDVSVATRVGTYERVVAASLERVWENVRDWEHLPWLHRQMFAAVHLRAAGAWGWRAEVALRGAAPGNPPLDLELRIDDGAERYHARTLAGPGTGTDIVTSLTPAGAQATAVHVEFLVPDVPAGKVDAVAAAYRRNYARLWDQDEAMMIRRQASLDGMLDPPAREVLVDGRQVRFRPVCPHRGGPLEDAPVEDGCVPCPWHGYRFDLGTGAGVGACRLRLPDHTGSTPDS
jgi:phenylpropionate dioxygenase-like ring-hydroxylating dioxygenase large terminal subunit